MTALQAAGAATPEIVRRAVTSQHAAVRVTALKTLAALAPADAIQLAAAMAQSDSIPDARAALEVLAAHDAPAARTALAEAVSRLRKGSLPREIALDVIDAATRTGDATLAALITAYQESKDATDPLSPYLETLHGGDAELGQAVFQTSVTAQCTLCHRVNGPGSNVGPALNRIGEKTPAYLLQALVDPGAVVAPGFGFITAVLKNGEAVGGTLMEESPQALTIKLADGSTQTVALADITERTPAMSSMPPMGQLMNPFELRDLLAYLQTLRGRNAR